MTQSAGLNLIAMKQKLGDDDARSIAMPVLIHLDCAKRGECDASGANFLTTHLIIASYIASRLKSAPFHAQVTKAYAALGKASDRPTKLLSLTTSEYQAIKTAIATYLRIMPNVEVGLMHAATVAAKRIMA